LAVTGADLEQPGSGLRFPSRAAGRRAGDPRACAGTRRRTGRTGAGSSVY